MAEISRRLAAVSDSRGRIVSIFVGAVLLPSIALSVLSFNAVPKQAENLKLSLLRQAEQLLYYVEEDLEQATRKKALEAARAVDPELLLEGRPAPIRRALAEAGMADVSFDSLRLEAWSESHGSPRAKDRAGAELAALSAALAGKKKAARRADDEDDAVPLTTASGEELGVVRFRFSCDYAHRRIVQDFFENVFSNPGGAWVIRVSEPTGELLYESAATDAGGRFEVERVMTAPSFEGVRLQLRYRDRTIEQEVRRLAIAKTALIGFIDLMLLAGLGLVWANVRRELKLSRLKSDFVANVSHELKTPLALIRLYAETLELGRVPAEGRKGEYYRVINKESRRLTQLINNILDFSRIEAGRKEYRLVPSDVAAVVSDVVENYRFAIEKQGFALELELAEELPPLALDPEALSQALINLLNNAAKYSLEQKSIRVSVAREVDRVLVSVCDRGIGIPRSEHRRIFEKFYRVETSLVHTTKGSGLGLALVQHIAEAHGGHVEVRSAPGEGSTFTLSLPVPAEPPAPLDAPQPAAGGTIAPREVEGQP